MIDKDLKIYDSVCTGCSACTEACAFPDDDGISPIQLIQNTIGMAVPRINEDTCVECMACYRACPTEDKIYHNNITFRKYKETIGTSYFGYSLDTEHRKEAATAGIATQIAAYLLDTNQVDGVISSYQDKNNKIITEIFTDSLSVKETRRSIYRQVPLLNGLFEKIKEGNYKKLLVIGLSCHIEGLKTLQKANKYLRKNVEFITVALFCKQTKTEAFSDFERSLLKAKPNQKLDYRGKGWPGTTSVEGGNSMPADDIKLNLMWGSFAFTPSYCFTCSDPLGTIADISVGDAWLPQYRDDKQGSSLFVANTTVGKNIIEEMDKAKIIYTHKESAENIIKSQSESHIRFKTSYIAARINAFEDLTQSVKSTPKAYNRLIKWIKLNRWFYEMLIKTKIIRVIPSIVLKVYGKLSSMLFIKLGKH